jgi:capsule polysaccharide export protein KpsE/RkpR
MAAELEKMKNEIKDLKTQLHEKHVKASKSAADQATIEALEGEKVLPVFITFCDPRDRTLTFSSPPILQKASMQSELAQKAADIEKLRADAKVKEETQAAKIEAATAAAIKSLEKEKVSGNRHIKPLPLTI